MRDLAILTFQTLDGVMQSPGSPQEDPSGGFCAGGWANQCWDEVMQQVKREAMAQPYELLLGRKTYDLFARNMPAATGKDPVATMLNEAVKHVVTSSSKPLEWVNSHPVNGDVPAEIARLKQQDGLLLQVHGSWQLIQTLLANDLIDEFRIWTFPVTVGTGKRLFGNGVIQLNLKLIKSEVSPGGAIMSIYRRFLP